MDDAGSEAKRKADPYLALSVSPGEHDEAVNAAFEEAGARQSIGAHLEQRRRALEERSSGPENHRKLSRLVNGPGRDAQGRG